MPLGDNVKKLNIGCGQEFIGDAINLDSAPIIYILNDAAEVIEKRPPDMVWDLNKLPWPFEDGRFELIIAKSVLEHLDMDLFASMRECWRILKVGGQIVLKLPHWQCDISYQDPTHRWFFALKSFDQFDPDTSRGKIYGHYTPFKWKIMSPGAILNKARSSIHVILAKRPLEQ